MTEAQFEALNNLLRAYYAFHVATQGRQYDNPHLTTQRAELDKRVQEARRILVSSQYDADRPPVDHESAT